MHYCDKNFKTKKALKDRVAARQAYLTSIGRTPELPPVNPVTVYNPETFSGEPPTPDNGKVCVGGPHYPAPHKWYATVILQNGEVVAVK